MDAPLSVAQLVLAIRTAVEDHIGFVRVSGEISNFTRAASGHCYFSLKDDDAQLRCAFFRNRQQPQLFSGDSPLYDGAAVIISGQVTVYERGGSLQLIVHAVQHAGIGALQQRIEQLRKRLQAEGLFDEQHKRSLPQLPRAIGIITSIKAAALHDVSSILKRRISFAECYLYPAAVQGVEAPAALCRALALAVRHNVCDVLIICRGGGSIEDLMAFNDEAFVRAVAASPIPTVSGVGHESDVTLVDFAADVRAPTPSAAAELVSASVSGLRVTLKQYATRIERAMRHYHNNCAQRLDLANAQFAQLRRNVLSSRISALTACQHTMTQQRQQQFADRHAVVNRLGEQLQRHHPRQQLYERQLRCAQAAQRLLALVSAHQQRQQQRLSTTSQQLLQQTRTRLQQCQQRFAAPAAALPVYDPMRTLRRGYALLRHEGAVVSAINAVSVGQTLTVTISDGDIDTTVDTIRRRDTS